MQKGVELRILFESSNKDYFLVPLVHCVSG